MEHNIKEERGVRIQAPLCDRLTTFELSSDFSLPDYQPEIKRLLRVKATVLPPNRYVGSGNAEFSGTVEYQMLYAANDGALYSTTEQGEYRFSVPVEMTSDFEWNEGIGCDCELVPESTVGRLLAPRKFSVKCRLKARVCLWGTRLLEEIVTGAKKEEIQRLCNEFETAEVFVGTGDALQLGDEILYDAKAGDPRVILAEGQVFVSDATAGSGIVCCRGEVVLKLLIADDQNPASAETVWRRIPFVQDVPTDGASVNCDAFAGGVCSELHVSVEENRILCDLKVHLQAQARKNSRMSYTRDIYSTVAECEARYTALAVSPALKCIKGNLSVNGTVSCMDLGIRQNAGIIDLCILPSVAATEAIGAKYVISGRCRCQAILHDGQEFFSKEFEIPFRYECDGSQEDVKDWRVSVEPISCRFRADGERFSVDAELSLTVATRTEQEARILREANFTQPIPAQSSVYTVCYPARDDTLWSIAKRYHRSVDILSAQNNLSNAPAAHSLESLAGVKYLLV